MGLLQNAVETYDCMSMLAGKQIAGKASVLAPIGHMTTKASIEITIDENGAFVQARKTEETVLFPATEASSARTSSPAPHPLCDQLGYLTNMNEAKHQLYMQQLEQWAGSPFSHPSVLAVLSYLQKGTIISDLRQADLLKYDKDGIIQNDKDFVCWRILSGRGDNSAVWEDTKLMQLYSDYYKSMNPAGKGLCYITGSIEPVAVQHLQGIVPISGRAKLISSNDKENFTFRGRFIDDAEAVSISYEASQKAHNALKWLVMNDGVMLGGSRVMICWNPRGKTIPKAQGLLRKRTEEKIMPTAYRHELNKIVNGYKSSVDRFDKAVVAIFDAATTGRLSIDYYNEYDVSDFLDRLEHWDETCCWYDERWGVSTPSLPEIVNYAFGTVQNGKMEVDDKLRAEQTQRLIVCRIDQRPFPLDITRRLVQKASNIQLFEGSIRTNLLFITCASVRKYRSDHLKEEFKMALEPRKRDRSYQYGRLLAVMEKVERDTYNADEKRETNAIRLQTVFVKRPAYATGIIMNQLKTAYYPQLNPGSRAFYERLIGEIIEEISECGDPTYDKPLNEAYLMGYYLQKNQLYSTRENSKKEEEA